MSQATVAALRHILVKELGVSAPIEDEEDFLFFRWFGYDFLMNCQSSKWLHLAVILPTTGVNEGTLLALDGVDRADIAARLLPLDGGFPQLRFRLDEFGRLRIDWTGFLFGSLVGPDEPDPDPLPEGFEVARIAPYDVAGVFETAMSFIRQGIHTAFAAFQQFPRSPPRQFPEALDRPRPDSLRLFKAALARNGLTFTEITTPRPALFFYDAAGAAFQVILVDHAVGAYAIWMDFLEPSRFNPDAGPANVIDGPLTQALLDRCQASCSRFLGICAKGSVPHGAMIVATNGVLPTEALDTFADLLPFLTGTLAASAEIVFAEAGARILTHAQERARRGL